MTLITPTSAEAGAGEEVVEEEGVGGGEGEGDPLTPMPHCPR